MVHPRQHIADLAKICRAKGVEKVVISPGSRNAPMIRAFYDQYGDSCVSLVDERSAAYFALGLALKSGLPVVLICTSGTAVLNYGPALAEAYYQQVPLLALTADRPHEWVDQQDNQAIHQRDAYRNFILASYELPQIVTNEDDLWYAHRLVNEAINRTLQDGNGPVHINIPLTEPLYEPLPLPSDPVTIIREERPGISVTLPGDMVKEWKQAQRVMIIHGQDKPESETIRVLSAFPESNRMIILSENIANLQGSAILSQSNLILSNNRGNSPPYPDLILHSGGQVISKALTGYLRRAKQISCWRIGTEPGIIDPFKLASRHIRLPAFSVYQALAEIAPDVTDSGFLKSWADAEERTRVHTGRILSEADFSDLKVFTVIWPLIPENTRLMLGNSSIVRYAQLFPVHRGVYYYSNRGVSGIDGCLSTAAGIASLTGDLTLVITGDLGFLYDSNALWNNQLPRNLRILLINNGGGGIFHILKGPSDHPAFHRYVNAYHPADIGKIATAFGLAYVEVTDAVRLVSEWPGFLRDQGRPVMMEVKTDPIVSAAVFRRMMGAAE